MGSARAHRLGLVALMVVAGLFAWDLEMVVTNPLLQREPWRDAARALGQASVPRAIVLGPNVSNPAPAPELITFQAVYLKSMLTMPDRGWNVREIDELHVGAIHGDRYRPSGIRPDAQQTVADQEEPGEEEAVFILSLSKEGHACIETLLETYQFKALTRFNQFALERYYPMPSLVSMGNCNRWVSA